MNTAAPAIDNLGQPPVVEDEDQFSMVTTSQTAAAGSGTAAAGIADNKFLGQKERRKSSSVKMFLGDYLSLSTNQAILKILSKNGRQWLIDFWWNYC